jgi:hypothetical protein
MSQRVGVSAQLQVWGWRLAAPAAFVLPLGLSGPPWRAVAAFWAISAAGRALQIARAPERFRPHERLLAFLLLVDPRPAARQGAPTPLWQLPLGLGVVGVGLLLFWGCAATGSPLLRTVAGGLSIVAWASGLDRALRAVLSRFGVHYPAFQRAPLAARAPSDFWGHRWNRLVSAYLAGECYVPVARRHGRAAGLASAFAASALLHAVPMALTVGAWGALAMVAFFGLHGLAVAMEGRVRLGRVHTWVLFGATAPLFVLPVLVALGL